MQMNYEFQFLKSLLITISIETAVLMTICLIFQKKSKIPVWVVLIAGITASFATLPYLWFIMPMLVKSGWMYKIGSELFAIIVESFILLGFLRIGYTRSLLYSFVCNMVSYGAGIWIMKF